MFDSETEGTVDICEKKAFSNFIKQQMCMKVERS